MTGDQPERPAVGVSRDGATVRVRLQRPDKLNALTGAMYDALGEALLRADADAGVHSVVISGEGRAFCAGNDLAGFDPLTGDVASGAEDLPASRFLRALADVRVTVVAAVHGACVGIGATMLLHCDIVVADPTARFSFPFTSLGLGPEAASSLLLPAVVGLPTASRLLLLGEEFPAEEAVAAGFVTTLTSTGGHVAAADVLATRLAALPRDSLRLTKQLLRSPREPVRERMDVEAVAFARRLREDDFATALAAFRRPERRQ